jgi:hypothetical protein
MYSATQVVLLGAAGGAAKYFVAQYTVATQYRGNIFDATFRPDMNRVVIHYKHWDGSQNSSGFADIGELGVRYSTRYLTFNIRETYSQKILCDYKSIGGTYYYSMGSSYDTNSGRGRRLDFTGGNFSAANATTFFGVSSMNSEAAAISTTGLLMTVGTDKNGADYIPFFQYQSRYWQSGGNQRQATDVKISSTNIAFATVCHTSQGIEVFKFDLAPNPPTFSAAIKFADLTTGQNDVVPIALDNVNGTFYTCNKARPMIGSMSTLAGVRRVTAFGSTPNAEGYSNQDNSSISYGADGFVYYCSAQNIRKMSADLTTCVWCIQTNGQHSFAFGAADGDVWIVVQRQNTTTGFFHHIVARIDASASQVSTTYATIVGEFKWQKFSSTVTTSTTFSTSSVFASASAQTPSTGTEDHYSISPYSATAIQTF